jgi:translation initiation factor 1 (eIF-1/SUI1)
MAMAKQEPKKKLDLSDAGRGDALKHNPFAALQGAAPGRSQPSPPEADQAPPPTAGTRADRQASRGRLVLRRETKHRGGKAVVVVAGFRAHARLPESEIAALAQQIKKQLGCGGTVERVTNDTELVLQGDRPARVAEILRALGFRVDGVTS